MCRVRRVTWLQLPSGRTTSPGHWQFACGCPLAAGRRKRRPRGRQRTSQQMNAAEHQGQHIDLLGLLGPAIERALNDIDLPTYLLDATGTLRWQSAAATELFGDRRGQSYLNLVAYDARERAKDHFARKIVGGVATTSEIAVVDRSGRRTALTIRAAPLRANGQIVGVFGVAMPMDDGVELSVQNEQSLTPRQVDVLRLLAEGSSTFEISTELGITAETVRNHIRGLFRRLGVHNRLEAVVAARRCGLLKASDGD
jgi:DNA-binding CsgD family transcriptional regulator